jgi:RNA polymerase sigma-70 factor (ECF subfamily)
MGRHPMHPASDSAGDLLQQQLDQNPAASSMARSQERRDLESEAIVRCLGQMIRQWQERGDYVRLKVLELLLVKGWANRDVAAFLKISEQQVANFRFAAIKKLGEHIRDSGLPADIFPELQH